MNSVVMVVCGLLIACLGLFIALTVIGATRLDALMISFACFCVIIGVSMLGCGL